MKNAQFKEKYEKCLVREKCEKCTVGKSVKNEWSSAVEEHFLLLTSFKAAAHYSAHYSLLSAH